MEKNRFFGVRFFALCATASAILAGCSAPNNERREASVRSVADLIEQSSEQSAPLQVLRTAGSSSRVRETSESFVSARAVRSLTGRPLPSRFEGPDGFVIARATPIRLVELPAIISEITKIPTVLSRDVLAEDVNLSLATMDDDREERQQQQQGGLAIGPGGMVTGIGGQGGGVGSLFGGLSTGPQIRAQRGTQVALRGFYRGPLSGFLDAAAAQFGISWEYDGQKIVFSRFATRTYTVHALPSQINLLTTLTATPLSGVSSSGGGGGGTQQTLNNNVSLQIWQELQQGIQSIIGGSGRMSASLATGTIVVNAPKDIMERVDRYIASQNQRLSKQVAMDVQILAVEFSDSDDLGLDLAFLTRDLARAGIELTFQFGNAAAPIAGGIGPRIGIGLANTRFRGSEALLKALSQIGKVSLQTSTTIVTLNGVPAPVQVTNTRGYLAEVDVSDIGAGVGVTTQRVSLRPGQVTTGFSLSVLPRVTIDGSTVLMQISLGLSELIGPNDGFREFSAPGGQAIQLPDIASRNFSQQAEVPDGATLLITGFSQIRDTTESSGPLSPRAWFAGGRTSGRSRRDNLIVLITPRIVTAQPVISVE